MTRLLNSFSPLAVAAEHDKSRREHVCRLSKPSFSVEEPDLRPKAEARLDAPRMELRFSGLIKSTVSTTFRPPFVASFQSFLYP